MRKLHPVRGGGATEQSPIASDRLVEGAPVARTSLDYERDGKVYAGEWSAGVGAWLESDAVAPSEEPLRNTRGRDPLALVRPSGGGVLLTRRGDLGAMAGFTALFVGFGVARFRYGR